MNYFKRVVAVLVVIVYVIDGIEAMHRSSVISNSCAGQVNGLRALTEQIRTILELVHIDTQAITTALTPAGNHIQCQLDVYSGIHNPTWNILPTDPLYSLVTVSAAAIPKPDSEIKSILGYRGFTCNFIKPDGTAERRTFARGAQTPSVMELVLLASGQSAGVIVGRALQLAYTAILQLPTPVSDPDTGGSITPSPVVATKPDCTEPGYNPANWNDGGAVQGNNNCYNYATNKQTGTFAQPGRAAGQQYTALTGAAVSQAAKHDGLTEFAAQPVAGAFPVTKACLVALVIDKNNDFHWFRQDAAGGNWSHKPGDTPATNKDNAGNLITDPRTANIDPYTFVKFMGVCPPNVTVNRK